MHYPNTYYYFLKENYPEVIFDESGESFAHLPLVAPERESITISNVEYQILEHRVVIAEDIVTDLPRQNNYSYVAILSMRDMPFLKMEVEIDTRNFQNSRVIFREVANTQEKKIALSDSEGKTIKRIAAFFSTPGMREIHAKKRVALQTVTTTYFTQLKQLWNAKLKERLLLVNELITQAQQMVMLGGQNFLPLLERLKKNFEKKKEDHELKGFHLVTESDLLEVEGAKDEIDDETIWIEDANNPGESCALGDRITMEFQQKFGAIDFPEGEIKERVLALDLKQLHETYARAQELLWYVANDNVAVSLSRIKQIHKVINVSLRTIVERLKDVLIKASSADELSVIEGSPGLRYFDEGIFAELIINKCHMQLAWLLNTESFAIDLISVVHEQEDLSLLEFAVKQNAPDLFGILLSAGANPIFVTRLNRCFAHDILQANLPFAQILCAVNSVKTVPRDFFQELALIVNIWKKYVELDTDIEKPELDEICQRYLSYSSEADAIELNFSGDHLATKFAAVRERTGLDGEFLRRYLVVNLFQKTLRDFFVAYQALDARYSSAEGTTISKYQIIQKLVSHLQNNLVVPERSSLRRAINLLAKATNVIKSTYEIIDAYAQIELNNSSLNPADRADARRVRLANDRLAKSVEKQESDLRVFVNGSKEMRPSQGGMWGVMFGGSKPVEERPEVTCDQQESIFAGPLLDILRAARTKCEHKVASMI